MKVSAKDKILLKEKILKESAKVIKDHGITGAPVDEIMKRSGATSGALYSQFGSKNALFHESVLKDLDNLVLFYTDIMKKKGAKGMKTVIQTYLTFEHLTHIGLGCIYTALGADMYRWSSHEQKKEYEMKYSQVIDVLATGLSKGTLKERTRKASFVFSTLVGTLVIVRTLSSVTESKKILKETKAQLLKYIN